MSNDVDRVANLSAQDKRVLLAQLLQKKLSATQTICPLSYGQQSMWFLYQLAPDSAAYNIAIGMRLRSRVNGSVLRRVFQTLIDRHAILRSTFRLHGDRPVQAVHGYREVCFDVIDVAGCTDDDLRVQVTAASHRPFDLEHGPVLRVNLFSRAADDHVLLIAVHHIAADGWSLGLMLNEFRLLYQAETSGVPIVLPQPIASYADFVKWQAEMLATGEGHRLRDYWLRQLAGALPVLNLPTDRPRPPVRSARGATHEFVVGAELVAQLKALVKATHATLYIVLLAAFQVLLHQQTGQDDLLIGSPMAGRSRAEFEGTVGYFVSPVVLRADLSGQPTFAAVVEQARQTVLAALDHQDYPFPLLVEQLQPRRDPSRSPVFDVMFNMQNVQRLGEAASLLIPHHVRSMARIGDLLLEPYPLPQEEGQFDLVLDFFEADNILLGALRYSTELFNASTISQMQGHYGALLADIVVNPNCPIGDLPLPCETERHLLRPFGQAVVPDQREEIEI